MISNAFGYASVHAFYPNMSKFYQLRFNFRNVDAGHISSIPYLIASFTVPFLGSLLNRLGEGYFEALLIVSISIVLVCHGVFLSLSDVLAPLEGGTNTILPLVPFGLGHALFTTL